MRIYKTTRVEDRFWSKVNKTDTCWLWAASLNSTGYGQININGSPMLAHRQSWVMANGEIPEGLQVCHTCDVPSCVNPLHLFLGTHQDNMEDMRIKGRSAGKPAPKRGGHWNSRLSEESILSIRSYPRRHGYMAELSRKMGVSIQQISRIIKGMSWKQAT